MALPPTPAWNPFRDRELAPWELRIGGVLYAAISLVAIDGVKIKREWKPQRSKETSENVYVWAGETTEKPELTLEATDEAAFDELLALLAAMAPKPGTGGGAAAPSTPPATAPSAVGSPAADFVIPNNEPAKVASVGPRPPTLRIENPILAQAKITAFASGDVELPTPTETNSWRVKVQIIPQKPQVPAGSGAMGAAKPLVVTGFGGGSGNTVTFNNPMSEAAAAQAAGT